MSWRTHNSVHDNCNGGGSISGGLMDPAPGGGGEGAEPACCPSAPWDVTVGRAAPLADPPPTASSSRLRASYSAHLREASRGERGASSLSRSELPRFSRRSCNCLGGRAGGNPVWLLRNPRKRSTVAINRTASRPKSCGHNQMHPRSRLCNVGQWEKQGSETFLGLGREQSRSSRLPLRKEWWMQRTPK